MSRRPAGQVSGNGIDELGDYFPEFDLEHSDRHNGNGVGATHVQVAADLQVLPPPSAPMEVARELVDDRYKRADALTLRHWRGGWWKWQGPRWAEVEQRAARAAAYAFTEHAVYADGDKVKPWAPNRHKIADLLEALAAIVHLP
jgi:hypothetical protein